MSKYAPHRPSTSNPRPTSSTVCQKCLGKGHFIYECKSTRPYLSRPSRTQQLENPRTLAKLKQEGQPSVEVPAEFKKKIGVADKILEAKEKERAKEKRKDYDSVTRKRRRSESSSFDSDSDDSQASESESHSSSDSDSNSNSSSSSGSSHSRSKRRQNSSR